MRRCSGAVTREELMTPDTDQQHRCKPTRADEVAAELRQMMRAAETLPLPEHLLKLLDELEEEERRPPSPRSANGGLRR